MKFIWKISVVTLPEAEDVVAELLSRVFRASASAYTDNESGVTTVAVYCDSKPVGLAKSRAELRHGLATIRSCGIKVGAGRISVAKMRREDWAEAWKRHFKPIEIGHSLMIKPSWLRRLGRKEQAVVVLDPGLSFGTGHHPTTSFCLKELVRRRYAGRAQSFLDIGTGSGILAIAAAKLGYNPVVAFDFDPESVRVARANAIANDADPRIKLQRADITRLPARLERRYDVVAANLISTLLISECRRIVGLVQPGGVMILAGILNVEFKEVEQRFTKLGARLIASRRDKEWRSGSFLVSGRQIAVKI